MRVRARVEERRHQRVRVELALELKRRAAPPGVPDRADRKDELAHPSGGLRPGHRVAAGDVRLDLRAEAEDETALRKGLDVIGLQRHGHRVARKGDRYPGADLDLLRALSRQGAADEGIYLRLDREPAVVAVNLGGLCGIGCVVHRRGIAPGIDLHSRPPFDLIRFPSRNLLARTPRRSELRPGRCRRPGGRAVHSPPARVVRGHCDRGRRPGRSRDPAAIPPG